MDHRDHLELIRDGVAGSGPRWLELGAGDGAFTLALADLLGVGGDITAVDRDAGALRRAVAAVARRFPAATLALVPADFERGLPPGPFDGVLAANSLHFVADRGNPWVPHPFSFSTWREEAVEAGFREPKLIHRVPSRFLGAIYGAVTVPAEIAGATLAASRRGPGRVGPGRLRSERGTVRAARARRTRRSLASRAGGAR